MNIDSQEWREVRSSYFFRPGRKTTRSNQVNNPGILCYDTKYDMVRSKFNKEGTKAYYLCKFRSHPLYKCKAKLKIVNCKEKEEDKWVISTPKEEIVHTCKPNDPELEVKIKPIITSNPIHERPEWYKSICRACSHRFNSSSKVARCKDCDHFIHVKMSCSSTRDNLPGDLFCKICKPPKVTKSFGTEEDTHDYIKSGLHFQCLHCEFKTKTKFSIHRHILRKHCLDVEGTNKTMHEASTSVAQQGIGQNMINGTDISIENTSESVKVGKINLVLQALTEENLPKSEENVNQDVKKTKEFSNTILALENTSDPNLSYPETDQTVATLLTKLNLEHVLEFFKNEEIDMEVLKTMSPMELKSLGMKYGPAKKIITAVQDNIKPYKTLVL